MYSLGKHKWSYVEEKYILEIALRNNDYNKKEINVIILEK